MPVRLAEDDRLLERDEIPAVLDELDRQPVEELGVARCLTSSAEVVARLDQARPEQPLPESIDRDAGRQRVARLEEPEAGLSAAVVVGTGPALSVAVLPPPAPGCPVTDFSAWGWSLTPLLATPSPYIS